MGPEPLQINTICHGEFEMMPLLPSDFWNLSIGLYLFLGGLAGGSYVTGAVADFLSIRYPSREESYQLTARSGLLVGMLSIAIGGLVLLSHLGVPINVVRFWLFTNFASWMTIGIWVIVLFMILSALQTLWLGFGSGRGFSFPTTPADPILEVIDTTANLTRPTERTRRALNAFGAGVGILLIVYTALLLSSASKVVSLWDTTWLPLLFLASGLSMGIAATVGITAIKEGITNTGVTTFSIADDLIILAELFVLYLLFSTLASGGSTAIGTRSFILSDGWLIFWGGVVGVGLLAPLILSIGLLSVEKLYDLESNERIRQLTTAGYTVKFGFVIVGGLLLRLTIVYGALNVPLLGV